MNFEIFVQFLGVGTNQIDNTPCPMIVKCGGRRPQIKNPRPGAERGFEMNSMKTLSGPSLGSFQRVQLGLLGTGIGFGHMGRHIAIAIFPLGRRLGTSGTVPAGIQLNTAAAPVAVFDDFVTIAAIVSTALGGHERTLRTFANRCTNHWNHPPV